MSKKITDENGHTYVQKKPFYKRGWFWVLAIIVIFGIGSMGKESDGTSSSSNDVATSSSVKKDGTKKSDVKESSESKIPAEYRNALIKAKSYATTMDMSEAAIRDQLTSDAGEGFTQEAADYAMKNIGDIDWNKNALHKAQSYQDEQAMSKDAIREQLTSTAGEGFTPEQADYAIQHLKKLIIL